MFCGVKLFHGHPEIEGREKGEDVRLDECHQQFQEPHEYAEGNGYRRHGDPERAFDVAENKDQAHEAEDDDMPGAHVRKETDHGFVKTLISSTNGISGMGNFSHHGTPGAL